MYPKTSNQFDYDLETSACFLSCAIRSLYLLQDLLGQNICAGKEAKGPPSLGFLAECCDAMTPAIHELDRILEEMEAAIRAAYGKGDCT